MSKEKDKKKKKKNSQLVIRIEKRERDAFVALCDQMDTTAARELRRHIRAFVEQNTPNADSETAVVAADPQPEAAAPPIATTAAETADAAADDAVKPAKRRTRKTVAA